MDEYAFQLSGGLRQRAMIATALSCDPKLLIADEPTTALDVTTQAQILDLLRELQEQNGMAIMLITHNLGVVAEMADDVVGDVPRPGRRAGPVDDIFHHAEAPVHAGAAALDPELDDEPRTQAADDQRLDSAPVQPAARLPVPSALRRRSWPARATSLEPQLLPVAATASAAASCTRSRRVPSSPRTAPSRRMDRTHCCSTSRTCKKFFPITAGLPAQARRPRAGRRRRVVRRHSGRDARAGRRIGLRQDDDRALHPARVSTPSAGEILFRTAEAARSTWRGVPRTACGRCGARCR